MSSLTTGRRRLPGPERRARLIEAAQRAFAATGYAGTSTLEIARQADVSEALVLKHFGSKDALFRAAVIDPLMELLDEVRRQNVERAGGPTTVAEDLDRLRAALIGWAALVRDRGDLLLTLLSEMRAFPEVGERLQALWHEHADGLADSAGLVVGGSADYRPFDVRFMTYVALAAATLAAVATEDAEAAVDEFVDALLLGVLSQRGRARLVRRRATA